MGGATAGFVFIAVLALALGLAYRPLGDYMYRVVSYLRQYLKHLRRKLEDDPARPRHLLTEPGMGYRFQP